jgi:hypothetical protein
VAWTWSGDYYDPAFPAVIELHHELWARTRDRIDTPGLDGFWARRVLFETCGLRVAALADPDRLAFAALHLLRHVLRNNLRPSHAYELAGAVRLRVDDAAFWERWRSLYPPDFRRLQTIAFQFASVWFNQPRPGALEEEWRATPAAIRDWFRSSAFSPVTNLTEPNKHVLWLHLALLPRWRDRLAVTRRRLFPVAWPRRNEAGSRARYHAVALWRAVSWLVRRPKASSIASHTSL